MPRIGADRGAADVRRHRTHPPRQDRLRHDDEHQDSERPRCRRVMRRPDLGDRLDGDAEAGAHQHRRHDGRSQRLSLPVAERVMLAWDRGRKFSVHPRRSAKRRCRPWIRRHPPPARSCCQEDRRPAWSARASCWRGCRTAPSGFRDARTRTADRSRYRASAGPAPFSASSRCLSRVLVG